MGNMVDHSAEILHESYNSLGKTSVSNNVVFNQVKWQKLMIKFSQIDKLLTKKIYFTFEVSFQFLLSPNTNPPPKTIDSTSTINIKIVYTVRQLPEDYVNIFVIERSYSGLGTLRSKSGPEERARMKHGQQAMDEDHSVLHFRRIIAIAGLHLHVKHSKNSLIHLVDVIYFAYFLKELLVFWEEGLSEMFSSIVVPLLSERRPFFQTNQGVQRVGQELRSKKNTYQSCHFKSH